MKNANKDIESSYLMYLDANNLYEWRMSQKLSVNDFKWIKNIYKFDEDFTRNYDVDSNKGCILEVDVEYPKNLLNLHSDFLFLAQRKKIYKCKILVCNINDKENYVVHVVHIRALKQASNHGLILKKYTE